jgi:hypothetical protein
MRPIVTAGASTCALALIITAFQYQRDATDASLPAAGSGNATASREAFNATSSVLGDVTIPLASGLPMALIFAFTVTVLMLAWGVSGR